MGRPDSYLKVAARIVPKELDITSQGVADMTRQGSSESAA